MRRVILQTHYKGCTLYRERRGRRHLLPAEWVSGFGRCRIREAAEFGKQGCGRPRARDVRDDARAQYRMPAKRPAGTGAAAGAGACWLTLVVFVLPLALLVLLKAAQHLNVLNTPVLQKGV